MKGTTRSLLNLLLVVAMTGMAAPASMASSPSAPPAVRDGAGPQLIRSDADGVVFDLHVPTVALQSVVLGGAAYQRVTIPGYGPLAEPGQPAVPARGWMLGLPPGAEAHVRVTPADIEVLDGVRVAPAAHESRALPAGGQASPDTMPEARFEYTPDPGLYGQDAFWPAEWAKLDAPTKLRDLNTVVVAVYPVQFNPARAQVRVAHSLRVEIDFTYPQGRLPAHLRPESASWTRESQRSVLNWDQAQAWRDAPQATQPVTMPVTGDAYRINVASDGLYQVNATDFSPALPSNTPVGQLKLANRNGAEVRIRVVDVNGDGYFNTTGGTDYFLFWGEKATGNKYSSVNPYWFTYSGGSAGRMQPLDGTPSTGTVPAAYTQTLHLEQNRYYRSGVPDDDSADHWYWDVIGSASNPARTYTITLAGYAAGSDVLLRLKFYGYEDSGHTVRLNWSTAVMTYTWTGQNPPVQTYVIPAAAVVPGANTLVATALRYNGTEDHFALPDYFEVSYRHTYTAVGDQAGFSPDVTGTWKYQVDGFGQGGSLFEAYDLSDPLNVRYVINGQAGSCTPPPSPCYRYTFQTPSGPTNRFLVQTTPHRLSPVSVVHDTPSTLTSNLAQTDYILLVADSLADAVTPLAALRQSQGYTVRTVLLQDVYDEFSGGMATAEAIKSFLAWAYAHWTAPAPSFVVLVGDGNFDPQGYCLTPGTCPGITGQASLLPAYLIVSDPYIFETVADHCYVASGACGLYGAHSLPFMHLGRIPAKDLAEATTAVNKLVAYEAPPAGLWRAIALNTCDNGIDQFGNVDPAGNFYITCDDYGAAIQPYLYLVDCDYYSQYAPLTTQTCYQYNLASQNATNFKNKLISTINRGVVMVTYTGHAAIYFIGGSPHLIDLSDVDQLTNATMPVWWYPMTCYEGYYIFPSVVSVADKLLFAPNGGSIGSFSPTGLEVVGGHDYLRDGMTAAIFTSGERELGVLSDAAKINLWNQPGGYVYRQLLETYMLIGDPATHLAIQPIVRHSIEVPAVTR